MNGMAIIEKICWIVDNSLNTPYAMLRRWCASCTRVLMTDIFP